MHAKLSSQLPNVHFTSTDDTLMKTGFPLKSVIVFYHLETLRKNCAGFLAEKFRYGIQNCILLVRRIILDGKTLFLKKNNVFIIWDLDRRIIWRLQTFFLHCWQNGNIRHQNTILNICSNIFKFSNQFR